MPDYGVGADAGAQQTQPSGWSYDWLKPQGSELRDKAMSFGGISPEEINKQAAVAGEQQRQQNISGYNSAVASQRGVNPTAAVMGMGQNLTSTNAQIGAGVQNIQAQNSWQGAQANQQMLMDYYKTLTGANASNRNAEASEYGARTAAAQSGKNAWIGAGASVLGAGISKSDERSKEPVHDDAHGEKIFRKHMLGEEYAGHEGQMAAKYQQDEMGKKGPNATHEFMASLHPQEYQYKAGDSADDGGQPHIGVMAQDLEKTPHGASAVIDSPEGKMVDTRHLSTMLAAAVGDLHQRLSKLEGRNG